MKASRITIIMAVLMAAAVTLGCATTGKKVPGDKTKIAPVPAPAEQVKAALDKFHAAVKVGDIDNTMAAYSDDFSDATGADKSMARMAMEGLIAQGGLANVNVNMTKCEIAVDGNSAIAKPVIYESPMGTSSRLYKLKKETDGKWRIVNTEEVFGVAALLQQHDSGTPVTEDAVLIELPSPQMTGGQPLMDVLKERKSTRAYSEKKLPEQVLSNLLWAAWGINRPGRGLHTAPSSSNQQELDVYVAMEKGLYLYMPNSHKLKLVLEEDLREATGTQRFVKSVPVNLIYVADHSRMYVGTGMDANMKFAISSANSGFIAQNVYLFCASEGLGTVVRGLVPKESLAKKMNLRPDQVIIYAQSVGYPRGSK